MDDGRKGSDLPGLTRKLRLAMSGMAEPTLIREMKPPTLAFSLLAAMSLNGPAAIVFQEDFNAPDGACILGGTRPIGQEWTGSAGVESGISGGGFYSAGISLFAPAGFNAARGAGQILTLSFETLLLDSGTFSGTGCAGISLYHGAGERVFAGNTPGSDFRGLNGAIASADTADNTATATATFT